MSATITDKKGFSCNVIDKERFNALSQKDKVFFELFRNAMLEIFPVGKNNTYENDTIIYAERFAFVSLNIMKTLNDDIDERLKAIEEKVAATGAGSQQETKTII